MVGEEVIRKLKKRLSGIGAVGGDKVLCGGMLNFIVKFQTLK